MGGIMATYSKLPNWRVARDQISQIIKKMEKDGHISEADVQEIAEGIEEAERS